MGSYIYVSLLVLALAIETNAYNSYMVVCPRSLRPGMKYSCKINLLKRFPRLKVSLTIESDLANYEQTDTFTILKGTREKLISLDVALNLTSSSDYRMSVVATNKRGEVEFKDSTSLQVTDKSMSIYIQTDKAIYKPGQTVRFRVFATDSNLAILNEPFDIDIFDSAGNKIAQFRDAQANFGVYKNHLKLSDQTPLGDWKIEVTVLNKIQQEKIFTVDQFVLPKFEVTVSLPDFGVVTQEYLTGRVTVKYTFGKAVEGTGALIITNKFPRFYEKPREYIERFKINGEYKFQVPRKKLFQTLNVNGTLPTLLVRANVTETLTDKTLSGEEEIRYYDREEKLAFLDGSDNFKPGLNYTTYIMLSDQNDKPLGRDANVTIKVKFGRPSKRIEPPPKRIIPLEPEPLMIVDEPKIKVAKRAAMAKKPAPIIEEVEPVPIPLPEPTPKPRYDVYDVIKVPKNGIASATFDTPEYATSATIYANYGKLSATKYLQPFESPSKTYIQVSLFSSKRTPQAGRKSSFLIRSTRPRIHIMYLIISRGKIIVCEKVFMKRKTLMLQLMMTSDMAPTSRLLVYYVRKDAEIVADSISFNVEGIFENKVNLRFSRRSAKPGNPVSLIVKADPTSQCSVLTVDKSVLLLKTGNDITTQTVEDELAQYDSITPSPCDSFRPCLRRFLPFPIPGTDAASIFRESGLVVMTDAALFQSRPPTRFPVYMGGGVAMLKAMPPMMVLDGDGPKMVSSAPPRLRQIFPETWLFSEQVAKGEVAFDEAMPLLKSAGGSPSAPRLRQIFPETWLFSEQIANEDSLFQKSTSYSENDKDGKCIIDSIAPDTITTWVATAFAVNQKTGLGVSPNAANLRTFLNFFIRLELPYSVIRYEQVILQAIVFNFYNRPMKVHVTLKRSDDFQVIKVVKNKEGKSVLLYRNKDVRRTIMVPGGGGVTVNFPIRATTIGSIDIIVEAISPRGGDAVKRQLLVKAEGIPEGYNIPFLVQPRPWLDFYVEQIIEYPADVVEGSQSIRISVIGDLMGQNLDGLTNLLQMPYGCGEQNMITFVPNIYVVGYLNATGRLLDDILATARGYMVVGYQTQLTYQRLDGSFSAFGMNDQSGSTWLTAFVVKSFAQAHGIIFIDELILRKAIRWIVEQADLEEGVFNEPGRVIHTEMQGGSSSGKSLTAFTLIALLEASSKGFGSGDPIQMVQVINTMTASLEADVDNATSTYELCILSYALAVAGSNRVDDVLALLEEKASSIDGTVYWEVDEDEDNSNLLWRPPYIQARSRSIEATAYVLLTYAVEGEITSGLNVLRWLVRQRNENGGFGSTQDTVIALQALSEFAKLVYSPDFDLIIDILADPIGFGHTFVIDQQNALQFQVVQVPAPNLVTLVKISATGQGIALANIAVNYNVKEKPVKPSFWLSASTNGTLARFELTVCFRFLGEERGAKSSMTALSIGLLSGFGPDRFTISDLSILKRVDEEPNALILYLDEVTQRRECVSMVMERQGFVYGVQPALIEIYDFYQTEKQASILYRPDNLRESSICDMGGDQLQGC